MTSTPEPAAADSFPIRPATHADVDAMTDALTTAFFHDPVWGPVFPDESRRAAQSAVMWRAYAASALRYPWTFVTPGAEAAAIWIPPGGVELTDEEDTAVEPLLRSLIGSRTDSVLEGLHRFDASHPNEEPHYYLSLLGTRNDRRGAGIGMALLDQCLAAIDTEHAPAYLESSNPLNNRRYEAAGFVDMGTFAMPDGGPTVTRMWRPAR